MMVENPNAGICDKCKTISCCVDFVSPCVTPDELNLIIEKTGFRDCSVPHQINGLNVYSLKPKPNTQECIFLDENQKCSIYDYRPLDCRLFPFDIYKIDGVFTWIIFTCNKELDWIWTDEILINFEKQLLTPEYVKHLNAFCDLYKMSEHDVISYEYKILRKVNFMKNLKYL